MIMGRVGMIMGIRGIVMGIRGMILGGIVMDMDIKDIVTEREEENMATDTGNPRKTTA
jgi:hypothetical protein